LLDKAHADSHDSPRFQKDVLDHIPVVREAYIDHTPDVSCFFHYDSQLTLSSRISRSRG
jgi:hypothetical protein